MNIQDYLPFYHTLSQSQREHLGSVIFTKFFKKRSHLNNINHCPGFVIVSKGELRAFMLSQEGKEITLYTLSQGDMCLLGSPCLFNGVSFHVFLEAKEDSQCLIIPSEVYKNLMNENPEVTLFTNQLMIERFNEVMALLDDILNQRLDQRLSTYLTKKCSTLQTRKLSLTHEEIAKDLGTAREVISRMLKHFEIENCISLKRGTIIIEDLKKLEAFSQKN